MPQNDFDIANQAGAAIRADLNSALQALATLSSGATAPATTYARMWWADTTSNLLKRRNAANSDWVVVSTLDEALILTRSSNTILGASDRGKTIIVTASFTQTLSAAATLGDGWHCNFIIDSGATLTLDPNSTETVDGSATKAIAGPAQGRLVCNGTLFRTEGFSIGGLKSVQVFTSSGTWNRPSGVRRVIVEVQGAGGGGGGAATTGGSQIAIAGPGAAGGYCSKVIDVSAIASSTLTIGAAGTAGTVGANNGGTGGASSWSDGTNTLTANGGVGGLGAAATTHQIPSLGGTASGGDVNFEGNAGVLGGYNPAATLGFSSGGGNSRFGAGGRQNIGTSVAGIAGLGYGSGGGGGANGQSQSAIGGGAGTAGIIVVWEYE